MYSHFFKRLIDIVLSLVALVLLSPVLLITAILIKIKLGSPIIFKQERPGKGNTIFNMYKFRSMTSETDSQGKLLPDDVRLTKFGKLLRSTSMDELPELWNILKGDMSIVGPRPQLVCDLWFMTEKERLRHTVLPGLTGWAQVNGRNAISWEDKFKFDLEYIEKQSFLFDFKIVLLTVKKVFFRENIETTGFETAEDLGDYLLRIGKITDIEYKKVMENKY